MAAHVVFNIRLEDDGTFKDNYIRLPPPKMGNPYLIRFIINASSLVSREPKLFTNMSSDFDRHHFTEYSFDCKPMEDPRCELRVDSPGCFEFYITYVGPDGNIERCSVGANLVVDPVLQFIANQESDVLPLDGISMLTVVPKWMPTIKNWAKFFRYFTDSGYNMIHFAPISSRGKSNSPYSIKDQLSISDDMFEEALSEPEKEAKMRKVINAAHEQYQIFSAVDIVWNHTSCDSTWLLDHPEAGYNLRTAPHLKPAFELDEALMDFSRELEKQETVITSKEQVRNLVGRFDSDYFQKLSLYEYFVLNVDEICSRFEKAFTKRSGAEIENLSLDGMTGREIVEYADTELVQTAPDFCRFCKTVDLDKSILLISALCKDCLTDHPAVLSRFRKLLNDINLKYYKIYDEDRENIMIQIFNRAVYIRLEPNGPKLGRITDASPLVDSYFTRLPNDGSQEPEQLVLANNGWIWNADPLVNFASSSSRAYFRRDVIPWGDCVKLRYGDGPEDSPWLWKHMEEYTLKMAGIFHGIRIDNCHSTPIHVASHFLDRARKKRPNLFVFAELFTGSEEKDILFVSKLGINSLIREAMNAWGPAEMSRLVHRQGGSPVGSFKLRSDNFPLDLLGHNIGSGHGAGSDEITVDVSRSKPHAIFFDCTHDNETPYQKRTAEDTLSSAALVSISDCAIGSVKGYDELNPKLLDIVNDKRRYRLPAYTVGIVAAKQILGPLHKKLACEGFSEVHVHQQDDYISIHRIHPMTHQGYLLIARTAFKDQKSDTVHQPIKLRQQTANLILCASLHIPRDIIGPGGGNDKLPERLSSSLELLQPLSPASMYHEIESTANEMDLVGGYIDGLPSKLEVSIKDSFLTTEEVCGTGSELETLIRINSEDRFTPGSIVLYQTIPVSDQNRLDSLGTLQQLFRLNQKSTHAVLMAKISASSFIARELWREGIIPGELGDAVSSMRILDVNVALFRSEAEDRDSIGDGLYFVPNFGNVAYGGIYGLVPIILQACKENNMGHPVFDTLRNGPWLMTYITSRLQKYVDNGYVNLKPLKNWLESCFQMVYTLSSSFIPKYFVVVLLAAYNAIRRHALTKITRGNAIFRIPSQNTFKLFLEDSLMSTFQFYGSVTSAGLIPKPFTQPLMSREQETPIENFHGIKIASLAAGLPHFATNYARVWGRDVFISMRGLLLIPGHFEAARSHLVAFASTLKHGLLPNLLDEGRYPRYNARDAVWFWFAAMADYCEESPEGLDFLKAKVPRRFVPIGKYRQNQQPPLETIPDDSFHESNDPLVYKFVSTVAEICFEIFERHSLGIKFREWNAGQQLDHCMTSRGFEISINTLDRGYISGGNIFNCGTWMDKMGDSESSGNKGVPSTPREGAPIEIQGLVKRALAFVVKLIDANDHRWPFTEVETSAGGKMTFKEWNSRLAKNFESDYYIRETEYYRDTINSVNKYQETQLRPNQVIAMTHAPELFHPAHARKALLIIKDNLFGPIGMKTLTAVDPNYRGYYDNSNSSNDPAVANGANYHNGPEWVWIQAYFFRAYHYFFKDDHNTTRDILAMMNGVVNLMASNENYFGGLPELTNSNGQKCNGSCPTQAWSTGVFIELLQDLCNKNS